MMKSNRNSNDLHFKQIFFRYLLKDEKEKDQQQRRRQVNSSKYTHTHTSSLAHSRHINGPFVYCDGCHVPARISVHSIFMCL